jgi:membrane-associated phospholipid phosphatase
MVTATPNRDEDRRWRAPHPALAPAVAGPIAVLGGLAALVLVAVGALVAGGTDATAPDRWLQGVVAGWWPDPGEGAYFIDYLGDPLSVAKATLLLAVVCIALGRRRLAVVALLSPVVTGMVTTLGKPVVLRTIHGPENLSYPSGHIGAIATLAAVLLLLVVDLLRTGRAVGLVLFVVGTVGIAAVMAVDQVAIDAHYPSDTLGGLCAAVAVVAGVALVVDRGAEAVLARRRR